MMVPLSTLSLVLLLYVVAATSIFSTTNTEYIKLPLVLHKTPHHHHHHHHRHHQSTLKSPVISGASSGSGEYLISLELGSPPQPLLLVADTGSDLIWVKCSACHNCSLHPPGSAFLARHSSSFSPHHCFQPTCRHLVPHPHHNPCNHTNLHSPCRYQYSYADGSLTAGFFSKETITFNTTSGHQLQLQGFHFGCGFTSIAGSETFNVAHGVMGLGRGPISFSSQLGRRFGNKFSYCLMDYTLSPPPTSFLLIGSQQNDVVPTNQNVSFTPLLINPVSPTFYYIGIKSVYVDGVKLRIDPSVWSIDEIGNGGTIVDSGTTLTQLVEPAFREILTAFKRRVRLPSPDESIPGFDLCVNTSSVLRPSYPRLSFELVGKTKKTVFSPPQRNYFIETSEQVECLAIQPVELRSGFSVIGNLMQQGYLLEFDRDRSRLGFSRHGCALP
ncbi:hypothetical protein Ddye_030667 [Dipteronia dyeriana]|uniref:Peptidase A1 domain-containing protein n=1 Tax=Dipteronia dyeriana TaxID=168575 RepID=A0AAD9TI24_9ROSI|nr:hypothetical protein Ddye_030667 [Dipteronia dyeriana]